MKERRAMLREGGQPTADGPNIQGIVPGAPGCKGTQASAPVITRHRLGPLRASHCSAEGAQRCRAGWGSRAYLNAGGYILRVSAITMSR